MIQVIQRTFDILEFLAQAPDQPRPLGEIAGTLSLNPGTCANILKTMVARGYVNQVAPKKGYTLGPAAYALVRNGPYRRDLVQAAELPMTRLARDLGETVLIAALHRHRRLTLCQVEGDKDLQVRSDVTTTEDIYSLATGRLLLAYLSGDELETFILRHGLPRKSWPSAQTREDLEAGLREIRTEGEIVTGSGEVVAVARPLREGEKVVAALGLFLPRFRFRGDHRKKILAGMKATAAEITQRLSRGNTS